jgi:hypothetical protein
MPRKKATLEELVCSFCSKQFPRPFALRRHLRIHLGIVPYSCDFPGCDKKFNTSGNLSRHRKLHSEIRSYPCHTEDCKEIFDSPIKLKNHKRVHDHEKHQLTCDSCDWRTTEYQAYCHHVANHENLNSSTQPKPHSGLIVTLPLPRLSCGSLVDLLYENATKAKVRESWNEVSQIAASPDNVDFVLLCDEKNPFTSISRESFDGLFNQTFSHSPSEFKLRPILSRDKPTRVSSRKLQHDISISPRNSLSEAQFSREELNMLLSLEEAIVH